MEIHINAINHPDINHIHEFCDLELTKSLEAYPFISTAWITVTRQETTPQPLYEVTLKVHPSNSDPMVTQDTNISDEQAVKAVLKKMRKPLRKYKELHYASSHRNKNMLGGS